MNLDKAYEFLNFFINKAQGAYYSPEQLDLVVDRAQMALFNSYYLEYATSQRLNDAMNPFKKELPFSFSTSPSGLITMPSDYMHLLAITAVIFNPVTNAPQNRPVKLLSVDEKIARDNSQIVPVTTMDPYAIMVTGWNIRLYPNTPQAGVVFYLARPQAPQFVYTIISGRVIVYDSVNSVQLMWNDNDIVSILVKALSYIGINIGEQDIQQWSEMQDAKNMNTKAKL